MKWGGWMEEEEHLALELSGPAFKSQFNQLEAFGILLNTVLGTVNTE